MKIGCRETINFFLIGHVVRLHGRQHAFGSPFCEGKAFVLKGKTKTTCPFISKFSSFKIEKTQWLRSVFYAPQNIKKPFFTATADGLCPYDHHLAVLEAAYCLPNNMTLLHNGMHIGRQ